MDEAPLDLLDAEKRGYIDIPWKTKTKPESMKMIIVPTKKAIDVDWEQPYVFGVIWGIIRGS